MLPATVEAALRKQGVTVRREKADPAGELSDSDSDSAAVEAALRAQGVSRAPPGGPS